MSDLRNNGKIKIDYLTDTAGAVGSASVRREDTFSVFVIEKTYQNE